MRCASKLRQRPSKRVYALSRSLLDPSRACPSHSLSSPKSDSCLQDKLDSLLKRSGAHACEVAGVDNKRTRSEAYQAARTLFDMTGVSLRQFRLPSGIVRM